MNQRIAKILAGGAAAAILAGAAGATAFAQSAPTATPTAKPAAQQRADAFLNALAAKLGKTPDDLRSAVKSTEHDLVNQALQAGRINQDQATKLNQQIDSAKGLPIGRVGALEKAKAKGNQLAEVERGKALADFLGLQPKDLKAQLQQGKSLAQIAQAQGKTVDQLKAFISGQAKTKLDAAVTAGKLTQDRENTVLQKLNANLDNLVNKVPKKKA